MNFVCVSLCVHASNLSTLLILLHSYATTFNSTAYHFCIHNTHTHTHVKRHSTSTAKYMKKNFLSFFRARKKERKANEEPKHNTAVGLCSVALCVCMVARYACVSDRYDRGCAIDSLYSLHSTSVS